MATTKIEWNERADWVQYGIAKGWVTDSWCTKHDIDPAMTEEEADEWDKGGDPCCVVLKVL